MGEGFGWPHTYVPALIFSALVNEDMSLHTSCCTKRHQGVSLMRVVVVSANF